MDKFYVTSGSLYVTIIAKNPIDAACKALIKFGKSKTLSLFIYVNKTGFDSGADYKFKTSEIEKRIEDDYTSK